MNLIKDQFIQKILHGAHFSYIWNWTYIVRIEKGDTICPLKRPPIENDVATTKIIPKVKEIWSGDTKFKGKSHDN